MKMIYYATTSLFKYGRRSIPKGKSYLYLAEGPYSKSLIQDVCTAFNVLMVFIPIPFFWALFDQHATRWIFQAEDMDRHIGTFFLPFFLSTFFSFFHASLNFSVSFILPSFLPVFLSLFILSFFIY